MENSYSAQKFNPSINEGLTDEEVKSRISEGLVNFDSSIKTKTVSKIVKDNIFTLFNFINVILAVAILCTGSYKNLMFMGVVICNSIIGVVQEIRAKKAVDKLSLISSTKVTAIRSGKKTEINVEEIVKDDIILYTSGSQVASDCKVLDGVCEVNESLLTGESNSICKKKGDLLLSGSFLVSGECVAKTEHVGDKNYVSTILHGTKYIKNTDSEIMATIKKIIKIISISIIPIGILLFTHFLKINNFDYNSSIVEASAALIGMIPEGLVLLISTVLAVGVMRLSKYKVLVQDIYCIETLARVDMLCLDKTGTITTGDLEVCSVIPKGNYSKDEISNVISSIAFALHDKNSTFRAIKEFFPPKDLMGEVSQIFPFSSEKKWSGAEFANRGFFALGAAEFMFPEAYYNSLKNELDFYSKSYRVLALAHSKEPAKDASLNKESLSLIGFILLKDKLRSNAKETLKYFAEEGVGIKIISGDNAVTVSNIAKSAGLSDADKYIDATTLKTQNDIKNAVNKYTIFGRVTPNQKLEIIKSLKGLGHTVAMTGDGVNDVLALKESDCSIAIASGSDAARNVSHLVLLDSDFSSMPKVVKEGRRAINNIQRSSSLFLVKTIYSALLSVLFLFLPISYPFMPIQMTLISALSIGIPSFVLALEPNKDRVRSNLFKNIMEKSLPTAIITVIAILSCVAFQKLGLISSQEYSTFAVILTAYIAFMLLYNISTPFSASRKLLFYFVIICFIVAMIFFRELFSLCILPIYQIILLSILTVLFTYLFNFVMKLIKGNVKN